MPAYDSVYRPSTGDDQYRGEAPIAVVSSASCVAAAAKARPDAVQPPA